MSVSEPPRGGGSIPPPASLGCAASSRKPGSIILGTGRFTPDTVRTNADLATMVDTSDEWIADRTGIRERRIAEKSMTTSDMATAAANRAMAKAGITGADLDMIIVATISGDMPMPACAVFVQQKVGAKNCPAFDISAACAGFIYGISIADRFIRAGGVNRVLVVGVELLSRVVDWQDRATCVLFGDGAGAVVLGPTDGVDGRGILSTHIYTDGGLSTALQIPAGGSKEPASADSVAGKRHVIKMEGQDVFKAAVRNLASASRAALDANGLTASQVDWVVAHQANYRIVQAVAQRCEIPMERFYMNIHKYGNTSSASIPIALDEALEEGKIKPGQNILMSALGAGISWGSALVRW
jgi:3-oxoacyl-[acyl-carrier-protein] synthase III